MRISRDEILRFLKGPRRNSHRRSRAGLIKAAASHTCSRERSRLTLRDSKPHTELAVGAQFNAYASAGSHQIVFGIATEAWALPGSLSMLTGLEATTINMEPENPWRKIALWSTFKTRPDTRYDEFPADPSNMNAQALRIESQPGTGFERWLLCLLATRSMPRVRSHDPYS